MIWIPRACQVSSFVGSHHAQLTTHLQTQSGRTFSHFDTLPVHCLAPFDFGILLQAAFHAGAEAVEVEGKDPQNMSLDSLLASVAG